MDRVAIFLAVILLVGIVVATQDVAKDDKFTNYLIGTPYDDILQGADPEMTEKGGQSAMCKTGHECDKCPEGEYKFLKVVHKEKLIDVKVCCPNCGKYFRAGYSNRSPRCTCDYVEDIAGDCWKGPQCSDCDNSNNGRIQSIPVCCANCEPSGLNISSSHCFCLHNGPK